MRKKVYILIGILGVLMLCACGGEEVGTKDTTETVKDVTEVTDETTVPEIITEQKEENVVSKGQADAEDYIEKGMEYLKAEYTKENADLALEQFLKAEEAKDARGYMLAGYTYLYGYPSYDDRDIEKAIKCLTKVADNDPYASICLAIIYNDSFDMYFQDKENAAKYFENAKTLFQSNDLIYDSFVADYMEAALYFINEEDSDYEKAIELLTKAADAGNNNAMNAIGYCHIYGDNNYEEASKWYKMAAMSGNANSMNNLGLYYMSEECGNVDYNAAYEWFLKAAELGQNSSMENLGWMYETGNGTELDYEKAREMYQNAVDRGAYIAMVRLGDMYYSGHGGQDFAKAMEWYEKAANVGIADGYLGIGWMYCFGEGVEVDYNKAIENFQTAIDMGSLYGYRCMGYMYENGFGVQKDMQKAQELYDKAENT